jgi:hypothetical protein
MVGLNFEARAAYSAAPLNKGCPLVATAEITLPFSSSVLGQ